MEESENNHQAAVVNSDDQGLCWQMQKTFLCNATAAVSLLCYLLTWDSCDQQGFYSLNSALNLINSI